MNRIAVAKELVNVVKLLSASVRVAKKVPTTLFERTFYDIREKAKNYKEQQSLKAGEWLETKLQQDLTENGFGVQSVKVSLGKYKGSRFITSAKLFVVANPAFKENDSRTAKLLQYLQVRYSPKYQLKEIQEGVAFFNVR